MPPLPVSSGPSLVLKNGSKIRGSLIRRDTGSVVADHQHHHVALGVMVQLDQQTPALRHGLARVDQQVQQNLLDLVGVDQRLRDLADLLCPP